VDRAQRLIDAAVRELKARGGVDLNQTLAYDIAHAASAIATARSALDYARRGTTEAALAGAFLGLALSDLATRILGREALWAVADDWYRPFASFVASHRDPQLLASLAETRAATPRRGLLDGRRDVPPLRRGASTSPRRARAPHQRRHSRLDHQRTERAGRLRALGTEEFGGFATGGESEYLGMVVATEELSWAGSA